MIYKEILRTLHERKLDSTVSALEQAVEDEAKALASLNKSKWNKRDGGKAAREDAEAFYAFDITTQLLETQTPSPRDILTLRRCAVAWAVAEILNNRV